MNTATATIPHAISNVFQLLSDEAKVRPHQPALIAGCGSGLRQVTYRQLEGDALALCWQMRRGGIGRGDRVLVLVPLSTDLYAVLLALFHLEAQAVFIDPGQGPDFVATCIRSLAPQAVIMCPQTLLAPLRCPALNKIPIKFSLSRWFKQIHLHLLSRQWKVHRQDHASSLSSTGSPIALVTATSGSTGTPKFIARSHEFLLAQHDSLRATLNLQAGDVHMTTLPMFILANLAAGVTTIIPSGDLKNPGRVKAAPIVAQLNTLRPQTLVAPPAFLQALAQHCRNRGQSLPYLWSVFTGGAPVFSQLLRKLMFVAPNARVMAVYGSSEAEPIAAIDLTAAATEVVRAQAAGRGLLAGKLCAQTELRIISMETSTSELTACQLEALSMPAGEPGEIIVAGPHVVPGYLNPRDNSQTKLKVGQVSWHRTGDVGYLDEHGRLWLLGRVASTIICDTSTLYPFAVEAAALEWPEIARAAIVQKNKQNVLVLETHRTPSADSATAMHRSLVGSFAIDRLVFVQKIPVDARHNSKVDYRQLDRLLTTALAIPATGHYSIRLART